MPFPKASLSSLQLDAFVAVAGTGHFTRASRLLGLSQSALSQRIKNLEEELGVTLFLRGARGATLTPAGESIFRFARARGTLEDELRADLTGAVARMPLRIAGFSSVMRSLVIPSLGAALRAQPRVELTCHVREMREILPLLSAGAVDYAITDRVHAGAHVTHLVLGEEENVLIESRRPGARHDVYLDHDEDDATTATYFAHHRKPFAALRRNFLDDIESIMEGVEAGLGRAVVPAHLCHGRRGVRRVPRFGVMKTLVVLHFASTSHPTKLHEEVVRRLAEGAARILQSR